MVVVVSSAGFIVNVAMRSPEVGTVPVCMGLVLSLVSAGVLVMR